MFAGLEAGGTKFVCVVGRGPDDIVASERIEVTDPERTIGAAVAFFSAVVANGTHLDALGIASFGPVELRPRPRSPRVPPPPPPPGGPPRPPPPPPPSSLLPPNPGWSGTDVVGPF